MVGTCSLGDGGCISVTNAQRLITYKDAIEFCELHRWIKPRSAERLEGFKKVEILLQQGEAYRQMWEELEETDMNIDSPIVNDTMYYIKQKYFPKEEPNVNEH